MATDSGGRAVKRKRESKAETSKKRARSESSDDEDPADHILLLESEIVESKKNYNNIATLMKIAQDAGETDVDTGIVAAVSLCRVFIRLLSSGSLAKKKGLAEKDVVVVHWLKERLAEYKTILLGIFLQPAAASSALTMSMRLLKAEGQYAKEKEEYWFPQSFLGDIVLRVLSMNGSVDGLLSEFVEEFVDEYEDIRFYTFKAVSDMFRQRTEVCGEEDGNLFDNAIELLSLIADVPDSNEKLENFYIEASKAKQALGSIAQHKKQAQEAWLSLLNTDITREQRKTVLSLVSGVIAPWFVKPELLMDFLTDCYNAGGSISLLALSGVFYLIRERNLDYPAFYGKLYSLLDTDILHSKHRSRFFRLMDTFLDSSHLPAQLVASFVKRLARLCLYAPPSAIVFVVPWIYNMFKKHPLCTFMIHRVPRTREEKDLMESEGLADPFLPDEEDPMETKAIDSCLWEIVQLQAHYHPNVATIAKIISEQFTKQFYNIEDFLDHSYGSLFEAEMSKEVKKPPVVEFQIPKRIFLPQDTESGVEDSLLVKLWSFS